MTSENRPQDFNFLAQAAKPGEVEVEQVETTNDPAESIRRGLALLYNRYLNRIESQLEEGLIDQAKADELSSKVLDIAEKDGVKDIIKFTSLERAREIMGPGLCFGPEEVKKVFGIEITERIPAIPFSTKELEKAKELGQFLVLRVDKANDGQPLTMNKISEILQPEFDRDNKGTVVHQNESYNKERFFVAETPKLKWALTTSDFIPDSTDKGPLRQIEILVQYLKDKVYADIPMPTEYTDAIAEFEASKKEIRQSIRTFNGDDVYLKIFDLAISRLTRQTAVEALYDAMIYFQITGRRIQSGNTAWSLSKSDSNTPLIAGGEVEGFIVYKPHMTSIVSPFVGVGVSRRR